MMVSRTGPLSVMPSSTGLVGWAKSAPETSKVSRRYCIVPRSAFNPFMPFGLRGELQLQLARAERLIQELDQRRHHPEPLQKLGKQFRRGGDARLELHVDMPLLHPDQIGGRMVAAETLG